MSAVTEPAADSRVSGPRVVVTVGTDHHQFDRLIGWINGWLSQNPQQAGAVFVQSGAASISPAASQRASWMPLSSERALTALMWWSATAVQDRSLTPGPAAFFR